ncbi:MAG TPA: glutathione S-transferase family protein [Kofleriaceae bacterium]|nr:glutathione S-transferase family protein [Kofleriaceae bacterium]
MITLTAFAWVPPAIQGFVRDYRVRWALEEAGLPYDVKLITFADQATAEYRALQPFGQVPALLDGELVLFETGAIVLHVAEHSPALMPAAADDRARVTAWLFAALSSLEPFVLAHAMTAPESTWEPVAMKRLTALADVLRDREYLVADRFTAADLMTASVLRNLRAGAELVARVPAVDDYVKRIVARPACRKAIADQIATFAAHAPS